MNDFSFKWNNFWVVNFW